MKSTPSRFWPLAAYGAVLAAGAGGAAWCAYLFIREVMQRPHPMTFIVFVFLVIGLAVASAGLRGRRSRVIPASRIEAILPALQYATTRDLPGRWNNTYSIRLGLDTGELVTIADGIKGASVATDLCERFASALRLDRAKVASIEYATTNVQRFKQARSTRRSPLAQQETP